MKHIFSSLLFFAAFWSLSAQSVFDSLYSTQSMELYFATGKADLDIESQRVLDSVVTIFNRLQVGKMVRITAHTDSVGGSESNESLSKHRAAAVSGWLEKHGVPSAAIVSVKTYGERSPAAPNATETGRRRNRRATIEVAQVVPMATFAGRVTDKTTGQGVVASITFRTKTRMDSTQTDTSGRYSVRLPKDSVVKVETQAKDYFFESVAMKVMGSPELYKKYKVSPDIQLPPAKPGEKVILRNLFFIGDAAMLLKVSEPELPKILKFMQLNPDLMIEIGGHVNVPYPQEHNFKLASWQTPADYAMSKEKPWKYKLSQDRAEMVYGYLVRNGIAKSRMTFKGYLNSQMLFPHATSTQEYEQNRRVEIKVTGKLSERGGQKVE